MAEYTYNGDEQITITAKDFLLLKRALEDGIQATMRADFPEVNVHMNKLTGELATEEDIKNGNSVYAVDSFATFSEENRKVVYDGKLLTGFMLKANELLIDIHKQNISTGVAKVVQTQNA